MNKQAAISVGDAKYKVGDPVKSDVFGGIEGTIKSVKAGENYATGQPIIYYVIAATRPLVQDALAEESRVSRLTTNGGKRKSRRRPRKSRRTRRTFS